MSYNYLPEQGQLTKDELNQLILKAQAGDKESAAKIVEDNIKYIRYIAAQNKDPKTGLISKDDLIGEGAVGMYKAIEKFEPGKGVSFSTYAYTFVDSEIKKALLKEGEAITVPKKFLREVKKAVGEYKKEHDDKSPSAEYLAEMFHRCPEEIRAVLNSSTAFSMEKEVNDGDDEITLGETLCNKEGSTENAYIKREFRENILKELDCLTEEERKVIMLRFGFEREPESLHKTGEELHMTKGMVEKIEKMALKKLRKPDKMRRMEIARGE